ncbi:unnamed protein product [Prorocentrum cordatum]|uniref:Uncharacterized protein n=1 Tax=Prorocentrum cordatum TaxID=2364126 RepID=A0ABN9WHN0_9DINO|nr:unnamed protein product [Polarella glacialis]
MAREVLRGAAGARAAANRLAQRLVRALEEARGEAARLRELLEANLECSSHGDVALDEASRREAIARPSLLACVRGRVEPRELKRMRDVAWHAERCPAIDAPPKERRLAARGPRLETRQQAAVDCIVTIREAEPAVAWPHRWPPLRSSAWPCAPPAACVDVLLGTQGVEVLGAAAAEREEKQGWQSLRCTFGAVAAMPLPVTLWSEGSVAGAGAPPQPGREAGAATACSAAAAPSERSEAVTQHPLAHPSALVRGGEGADGAYDASGAAGRARALVVSAWLGEHDSGESEEDVDGTSQPLHEYDLFGVEPDDDSESEGSRDSCDVSEDEATSGAVEGNELSAAAVIRSEGYAPDPSRIAYLARGGCWMAPLPRRGD